MLITIYVGACVCVCVSVRTYCYQKEDLGLFCVFELELIVNSLGPKLVRVCLPNYTCVNLESSGLYLSVASVCL